MTISDPPTPPNPPTPPTVLTAQAPDTYTVYILHCADGSLYTGIARELDRRLGQHSRGKGAKYVASRLPFSLVYQEEAASKGDALRREAAIKQLSRKEKLVLVSAPGARPGTGEGI